MDKISTNSHENLKQSLLIFTDLLTNSKLNQFHPSKLDIKLKAEICNGEKDIFYSIENNQKLEKIEIKSANKIEKLMDEYEELKGDNIEINLHSKLKVGEKFIEIQNLEEVNLSQKTTIKKEKEEVLILGFWNIEEENSIELLFLFKDIIQKNNDLWGSKVRFVGIGLSDTHQLMDQIEKHNINSYENCILDDVKTPGLNAYLKAYQIITYPHIVIIDNTSTIFYMGNPYDIQLTMVINGLLGINKDFNKDIILEFQRMRLTSNEDILKINVNDLYKCSENFLVFTDKLYKTLKYNFDIIFSYTINVKIDHEFNVINETLNDVSLKIWARKYDQDLIYSFLQNSVYPFVPKEYMTQNINFNDTFDFYLGSNCSSCKNNIKSYEGHYFCYFCKVFFCEKCAETVDKSKKFLDRLIHAHNLVYLKVENNLGMKNIDVYKLGDKSIIPNTDEKRYHLACCNACGSTIENCSRFICLSCRPGRPSKDGFSDFCENCFDILRNKSNPFYNEIQGCENLAIDMHDPSNHIFLRLYYAYHNYDKY